MKPTNNSNETCQTVKANKAPFFSVLLAMAISGCGGGSNLIEASQVVQPLVAATLATSAFVQLATGASCANLSNRLFVIDQKQVFWDKAGTCADASYSQVLFGDKPETILCSTADSIAGPRTICNDQQFKTLFETMTKNLDKADLGLGAGHTVQQVTVPGGAGAALRINSSGSGLYYGTAPENIVIKDGAAWTKFLSAASKEITLPIVLPDFSNQMVIGVFFKTPNDCSTTRILRVSSNGQKITVEYTDEVRVSIVSCNPESTQASTPMSLVSVDKLNLPVEFVNVNANKVAFSEIDTRYNSAILEVKSVVIKDAAAWNTLWAQYVSNAVPTPVIPTVDFSNRMVAGIFLGSNYQRCYGISVVNVWRRDGKLNVAVHNNAPGKGTTCSQYFTAAAELIELDRFDEPLEVVEM